MGEILPDGSIRSSYAGYCPICKKQIETNYQGDETGQHICIETFLLTHYVDEPLGEGYTIVPFMTTTKTANGRYFMGFGTHRPFILNNSQQNQFITPIQNPIEINRGQCVCLDKTGVFLADKEPFKIVLKIQ